MSNTSQKKEATTELQARLETLEKNVDAVLSKIKNAKVLNGGFDTVFEEIQEIKAAQLRVEYEIKFLVDSDNKYQKRISDITDLLYDPDDGIYKRIANATSGDEEARRKLTQLEQRLVGIESILTDMSDISKDIKKIAGDDLGELKSIVGTKNMVNKLFIVLITAAAGSVGTFIWSLAERFLK